MRGKEENTWETINWNALNLKERSSTHHRNSLKLLCPGDTFKDVLLGENPSNLGVGSIIGFNGIKSGGFICETKGLFAICNSFLKIPVISSEF